MRSNAAERARRRYVAEAGLDYAAARLDRLEALLRDPASWRWMAAHFAEVRDACDRGSEGWGVAGRLYEAPRSTSSASPARPFQNPRPGGRRPPRNDYRSPPVPPPHLLRLPRASAGAPATASSLPRDPSAQSGKGRRSQRRPDPLPVGHRPIRGSYATRKGVTVVSDATRPSPDCPIGATPTSELRAALADVTA